MEYRPEAHRVGRRRGSRRRWHQLFAWGLHWQGWFAVAVARLDALIVVAAMASGVLIASARFPEAGLAPLVCGTAAGVLLLITLPMCRAWEARILGQGVAELTRLGRAVALTEVALAFAALAVLEQHARLWVFGSCRQRERFSSRAVDAAEVVARPADI